MRPKAVNRNADGTFDLGIAQINTRHLRELSKFGIGPNHLLDACIGTDVAAWHLAKQYKAYGNTWYAIGAYHSRTAFYNQRHPAGRGLQNLAPPMRTRCRREGCGQTQQRAPCALPMRRYLSRHQQELPQLTPVEHSMVPAHLA
jgi:hypothetical protein